MMNSIVKRRAAHFIEDPHRMITKLMLRYCPRFVTDRQFIRYIWGEKMNYPLNIVHPQTYNEKLQWLKLNDRNPLYTTLSDKVAVKEWVANKIGWQYIIPTLGIYHSADEINLEELPAKFVLKCNHDSGGVFICKNKEEFDFEGVKARLSQALKVNYYYAWREWPYKNIKPLIFAETYMEDEILHDIPDYKFFAFNGKVKVMFIATERNNPNTETRFDFFDVNFNHLDVKNGHPNADVIPSKPHCFEEMIRLSEILSEGIPHVRCDFYEINGKVYFGEMTFYHWGGIVPFEPKSFDQTMGNWLDLTKVKA